MTAARCTCAWRELHSSPMRRVFDDMRRNVLVACVVLSACAPDMKTYFAEREAGVKALREKLGKAVALVDAAPTAENTGDCATAAPLVLNMFPSKSFPDTGNVAVVDLEEVRAAAESKPKPNGRSFSNVAGRGEQSSMTVLSWAREPRDGFKADARNSKAIDATLALQYLVVLREKGDAKAIDVDAFLVDLQTMNVVCGRHFTQHADGKATEVYTITGGGEANNGYRVGSGDRMSGAMSRNLETALRSDFKIRW